MNKTNKSFQFDSKRIHLTRSSFSCLANNNKPTCLLYGLLFHVQIPPRPLGIMPVCISRKMIMSAYFCFQLRKPYKCECFLFQNISVTLALLHTDTLSVRRAVLSFFSPKTHRMFRALSFLIALSTFTLEPHGTAQYFSCVYTEL